MANNLKNYELEMLKNDRFWAKMVTYDYEDPIESAVTIQDDLEKAGDINPLPEKYIGEPFSRELSLYSDRLCCSPHSW